MVIVEVAVPPLAGETDAGEKLHVDPSGCPEQVSVTAALKPLSPPRVTVNGAGFPAAIVSIEGVAAMLKSALDGGGVAFAVIAANRPCISLASPAVMYIVLGSPDCAPPAPNTMSQSEALSIGAPFASFIWSINAPVEKLYALIAPSQKLPTRRSPARGPPNPAGGQTTPQGPLR